MKKVTIGFSKRLQKVIDTDPKFGETNILQYALSLVTYVVEMGTTQKTPRILAPVSSVTWGSKLLFDSDDELEKVVCSYKKSGRIEVQIYTGCVDVFLGVDINFYPKGKGSSIMMIQGQVDSTGIRKLEIKDPVI